MGIEKRKFPRVKVNLKIGYEFVKWNEKNLERGENPNFTNIHDISASGIGVSEFPDLKHGLLDQLAKGKKKVRLAIYLNENQSPLMTFARLIWYSFGTDTEKVKRYGFVFLDVSASFFQEIKEFVDKHLPPKVFKR